MEKNIDRIEGMSFLDIVLTYRGNLDKMFEVMEDMKYNSNKEYFEDTSKKKYRINTSQNKVTVTLQNGTSGLSSDSGVLYTGDYNEDYSLDFFS